MLKTTMTINNNAITSLSPPTQRMPGEFAPVITIPEYSVTFSSRFEDEADAIAYAKFMLNNIEAFKNGER